MPLASQASSLSQRLATAAQAMLESFGELAGKARFDFDDEAERKDWSNLPGGMHPRNGLSFGEMGAAQSRAVHALAQQSLSTQGYAKVAGVMRLEDILRDGMDNPRASQLFGSDKYWVAVFGSPSQPPWGWQIDGHHLAVNFTSVGGELSLTPMFFGAEPEVVLEGPYAGWRVFAAERSKAVALVSSLSPEQLAVAVLSDDVPADIFEGPAKGGAVKDYEGIAASDLSSEQRGALWSLIDEYLGNAPPEVAAAQRDKIRRDGDAALYFAWRGARQADADIYYRIHGPSVLIEYDNTALRARSGGNSNHVHLILREPGNDFGADLLRRHRADAHGSAGD